MDHIPIIFIIRQKYNNINEKIPTFLLHAFFCFLKFQKYDFTLSTESLFVTVADHFGISQ